MWYLNIYNQNKICNYNIKHNITLRFIYKLKKEKFIRIKQKFA